MACYHPSEVLVERKLRKYDNPGDPRRSDTVTVPCGNCLGCRSDQARDWALRMSHESLMHEDSWFVTLTYDPENIPDHHSLNPAHSREFFLKLRKRTAVPLSYYLCGEYGDTTERPHYHAALFGPAFRDRELLTRRNLAPVYTSELLDEAWGHGLSEITPLTYEAAAYVAGYVRKKVRQRDAPDWYTRVDPDTGELVEIEREFARMSRRPAVGRRWLEEYWTDAYPRDFVVVNGHPFKPPRYYDKWMDDNHPEIMEEVRYQRWQDAENIGDEKLIMKEKIHRAKVRLFQGRDQL